MTTSNFLGVTNNGIRSRLGLLEDGVNSNRINKCVGSRGSRGSGGMSVFTPINYSSSISTNPFDLKITLDVPDSEILVKIIPGTVNGLLPSNVFATITEAYSAISPITYYASVTCATDGKSITGVTWGLSTSAPTGQTPTAWAAPASFSYLFGIIVGTTLYRTIAKSSLVFSPTFVVSVPKSSISPNIIPYDNYYNWQPINGTG